MSDVDISYGLAISHFQFISFEQRTPGVDRRRLSHSTWHSGTPRLRGTDVRRDILTVRGIGGSGSLLALLSLKRPVFETELGIRSEVELGSGGEFNPGESDPNGPVVAIWALNIPARMRLVVQDSKKRKPIEVELERVLEQ